LLLFVSPLANNPDARQTKNAFLPAKNLFRLRVWPLPLPAQQQRTHTNTNQKQKSAAAHDDDDVV